MLLIFPVLELYVPAMQDAQHKNSCSFSCDLYGCPLKIHLSVLQVASQIKEAVRRQLGLTMSFGVAMGNLAARLAGPLNKPSGMTVVPPQQAPALLLGTPIVNIPQLR